MKNQINSKNLVLNAKDKKAIIGTIDAIKDGYKKTDQLLADPILTALFAELSANELMEKLHGTEWKNNPDLALIIDRKRTKLGDAINYLKRVAKKATQNENENENENENKTKEKQPKYKKIGQIIQELEYLKSNFIGYSDNDKESIVKKIDECLKVWNIKK